MFMIPGTCFVIWTAVCAAPQERVAVAPTSPQIQAADLQRHVGTLASDALQGRAAGSAEAMEAARYLAAELKRFGVEPAGDGGTFFQNVPMGRTEFLELPMLRCIGAAGPLPPSVPGIDFDWNDGGCETSTLAVVTAASASEIPKAASAQTALVLLAESTSERNRWLAAAGMPDGAGWGLLVALGSKEPGANALEKPPRTKSKLAPTPRITVRGSLRQAFAERGIRMVTFRGPVRTTVLEAANVVGAIRGAGTAQNAGLASEIVEFSAHYDHLAPRPAKEGEDGIFNGADDDASGCAVVLELAEAFAAGPKPARTLLFFFATGEEIGLVGTRYSIEHPLVPLDKIVADVNFEMLGRPDPVVAAPARMWLTGFELSNLGEELVRLGVPVAPDARPEQDFFRRSDNFALAQRGIVAQTLSSFGLHQDYHKPSDEADTLDYAHMEACARGAFDGCRTLADGSFRPAWREGKDPSSPPKAREGAAPKSGPPSKDKEGAGG